MSDITDSHKPFFMRLKHIEDTKGLFDNKVLSDDIKGNLDEIQKTCANLQKVLNAGDEIPQNELENIYHFLGIILNEIVAYYDYGGNTHIDTAVTQLTEVKNIIRDINQLNETGSESKSPDEQYMAASNKMHTLMSILKNDSELLISTNKSTFESQLENNEERFNTFLNTKESTFGELEKKCKTLLNVASNATVQDKHHQEANKARKRVFFWNTIVFTTLAIVAIFTFFFFRIYTSNDLHWANLVSKAIITAPIASLTAYAARQVTKYEKVERAARRIALELGAFDPFISNLDEKTKSELKVQITKRLFGNTDNADEKKSNSKAATAEDMLKLLLNVTTKK